MGLPYKHNFSMTKKYNKYVTSQIKLKKHLVGEDGIPVSLEFADRERDKEFYDFNWDSHPDRDRLQSYMTETVNLCSSYYDNPKSVLEVGAGCGNMSVEFIKTLKPKKYIAYEFSNAADKIEAKIDMHSLSEYCDVSVIKESFRDISNLHEFDCVIALEIFEHIDWDLEFISKILSGTWVFFSVPVKQAKDHVRAFLSHESIWKRYNNLLDIKEIRSLCLHEDVHKWWCIASIKK